MYIDYVLCAHPGCVNKYIFQAPAWSGLKAGDEVIVETRRGKQPATVIDVYTGPFGDSEPLTTFFARAMGVTLPLKKVLKKIEYTELQYDDPLHVDVCRKEDKND